MPNSEYWHGFTFGIRTTEALEPTGLALVVAGLASLAAVRRRRII